MPPKCISIDRNNYGIYYIRAGEYNLKGLEGMEQEVEVLRIIRHVKYVTATYDNDIAIMGKKYGSFHKLFDSTYNETLHRAHEEGQLYEVRSTDLSPRTKRSASKWNKMSRDRSYRYVC